MLLEEMIWIKREQNIRVCSDQGNKKGKGSFRSGERINTEEMRRV